MKLVESDVGGGHMEKQIGHKPGICCQFLLDKYLLDCYKLFSTVQLFYSGFM